MLFHLSEKLHFPPARLASTDGLLAMGGDLSVQRLTLAYRNGIFPWYSEGSPILWWTPDPRLVLFPEEFHVSRTLKRIILKDIFQTTFDAAFEEVVAGCAATRSNADGTWIVPEMATAYQRLHDAGIAHSVETWQEGQLVGGLYGVSLGGIFFGESMFSRVSNASKVALDALMRFLKKRSFDLVDCQITSGHLIRMGAREIPRQEFLEMLEVSVKRPTFFGKWNADG